LPYYIIVFISLHDSLWCQLLSNGSGFIFIEVPIQYIAINDLIGILRIIVKVHTQIDEEF